MVDSIKIDFEETCEEIDPTEGAAGGSCSLEIDTEQSGSGPYSPGMSVYIKAYPAVIYDLFSNLGTVIQVGTNVPENIVDMYIIFTDMDEYSPSPPIAGNFSYDWVGRVSPSPGTPLVTVDENGKIELSRKSSGVLKVSYRAYHTLFRVAHDVAEKVLVVAQRQDNDQACSIEVDFSGAEAATEPYYIEVRDACNDNIIPGATVALDGTSLGVTGIDGKLFLGYLTPGQRYELLLTKSGYKISDQDQIANDYFIAE